MHSACSGLIPPIAGIAKYIPHAAGCIIICVTDESIQLSVRAIMASYSLNYIWHSLALATVS